MNMLVKKEFLDFWGYNLIYCCTITYMVLKLTKRSTKALISRQSCLSLAALILACLLDFPGQPTLPARDYGVTVRKVYDVARCYCRAT